MLPQPLLRCLGVDRPRVNSRREARAVLVYMPPAGKVAAVLKVGEQKHAPLVQCRKPT